MESRACGLSDVGQVIDNFREKWSQPFLQLCSSSQTSAYPFFQFFVDQKISLQSTLRSLAALEVDVLQESICLFFEALIERKECSSLIRELGYMGIDVVSVKDVIKKEATVKEQLKELLNIVAHSLVYMQYSGNEMSFSPSRGLFEEMQKVIERNLSGGEKILLALKTVGIVILHSLKWFFCCGCYDDRKSLKYKLLDLLVPQALCYLKNRTFKQLQISSVEGGRQGQHDLQLNNRSEEKRIAEKIVYVASRFADQSYAKQAWSLALKRGWIIPR